MSSFYFSVTRLREGGITQQLFERKINENEMSVCDEQSISVTEIKTFYGIYFVIIVAVVLSLVILVLEILVYKTCCRKRKAESNLNLRTSIDRKDSDDIGSQIPNIFQF